MKNNLANILTDIKFNYKTDNQKLKHDVNQKMLNWFNSFMTEVPII